MKSWIAPIVISVLLVLVGMRPLITESYATSSSGFAIALDQISDPSALVTTAFNAIILTCLLVVALAGIPLQTAGLGPGLVALSTVGILSALNAENPRIAINATLDWLCYPALTILLASLLRDHAWRRIFLIFILCGAALQAAKCLDDKYRSFDETWNYYQENKTEIWNAQGVPLNSDKVELFEKRMLAREASGYFPHSNVAGSYFALAGIMAWGCLFGQWRSSKTGIGSIAGFAFALLIAFTIVTTGSTGALLAYIVGMGLWLAGGWGLTRAISVRTVTGALAVTSKLAGLVVAAYGLLTGGLPGASLNFRWQYWTIARQMFADHLWLGVGRENFGAAYLQYKTIDIAEEVANPHNLIVQFACDFGIFGLIALIILIVGFMRWVVQPNVERPDQQTDGQPAPPTAEQHDVAPPTGLAQAMSTTTPLAGLGLGVFMLLLRLTLVGSTDVYYLYYVGVTSVLLWGAAFVVICRVVSMPPSRWRSWSIVAGLLAFIIHDMINFAFFVPGAATTFFACLGIWLSERDPLADNQGRRRETQAAVAWTSVMLALLVLLAVIPMARRASLQSAVTVARTDMQTTDNGLRAAVAADRWDPSPVLFRARYWQSISSLFVQARRENPENAPPAQQVDAAVERAFESVKDVPPLVRNHIGFHRLRSEVAIFDAQQRTSQTALAVAADSAKEVVRLYPGDPRGWIDAGQRLWEWATKGTMSAEERERTLQSARHHVEAGLALEESRPEWERIRGLRPNEIQAAQSTLASIRAALQPVSSGTDSLP
ncbi:MAG: O-antigen ligase family protein [Phycisphaerae bacterium]